MFILVSYDAPFGRSETYRKLFSRYLTHDLESVFSGDLTEAKFIRLRADIAKLMIPEDRVLIIKAKNRNNVDFQFLEKTSKGAILHREADRHKSDSCVI